MVYYVIFLFIVCLFINKENVVVIVMGWKGKEMGVDVKKVIVDLMYSGILWRKISELLKILKLIVIDICKRFLEMGFLENKLRSGRFLKIKFWDYCKLERIVKINWRCFLLDIIVKFNEERFELVSRRII